MTAKARTPRCLSRDRLGLGTVQFGLDYGIANRDGRTPPDEVGRVLALALGSGVRVIDTAPDYGASEEVLGKALPKGHCFQIVTKAPAFSKTAAGGDPVRALEESFARSLSRLRQESLYGLLIHEVDDLFADHGPRLIESMGALKRSGLVSKIGASVYTERDIDRLIPRYPLDLVQVPINVFDQRLLRSGALAKLKARGVEIHARSPFLQGLLLSDPSGLHPHFAAAKPVLEDFHAEAGKRSLTPAQAALGFVAGIAEIDAVIIGIDNSLHLKDNLDFLLADRLQAPDDDFSRFAMSDPEILDPARWPLRS